MISKKMQNKLRIDYLQSGQRLINQSNAHHKGKRTVVTISNPNKNETDKKFIKVEGKEYF